MKFNIRAPRILDLFCCSGGAAKGYHDAGFDVTGIDFKPQPLYPFTFIQADALSFLEALIESGKIYNFDAIHASPPCQRFSSVSNCYPGTKDRYPDLIEPVRILLKKTNLPWIIENVVYAPLINPVTLCGSMFGLEIHGLQIRRHRLIESSFPIRIDRECDHSKPAMNPYSNAARKKYQAEHGIDMRRGAWQKAMGVPWLSAAKATEAIPPAYTEFIGRQLLAYLSEGNNEVSLRAA